MEKKPSWVGVNKKKGSPDIIIYDKLLNKYMVDQKIGDEVGSDHLPLLFKIHIFVIKKICKLKEALDIKIFRWRDI